MMRAFQHMMLDALSCSPHCNCTGHVIANQLVSWDASMPTCGHAQHGYGATRNLLACLAAAESLTAVGLASLAKGTLPDVELAVLVKKDMRILSLYHSESRAYREVLPLVQHPTADIFSV